MIIDKSILFLQVSGGMEVLLSEQKIDGGLFLPSPGDGILVRRVLLKIIGSG